MNYNELKAPFTEELAWVRRQRDEIEVQLARLDLLTGDYDAPIVPIDVFNPHALSAAMHGLLPESGFADELHLVRRIQRDWRARVKGSRMELERQLLDSRVAMVDFARQAEAELLADLAEEASGLLVPYSPPGGTP